MGKRCRAWGESKTRRGAGGAHESHLASRVAVRRIVPGVADRAATAAPRRTERQRRGAGALSLWLAFRFYVRGDLADDARSEEHTSELQSLMRISYAVFCLKKKNN